jgi:hypothetical protein
MQIVTDVPPAVLALRDTVLDSSAPSADAAAAPAAPVAAAPVESAPTRSEDGGEAEPEVAPPDADLEFDDELVDPLAEPAFDTEPDVAEGEVEAAVQYEDATGTDLPTTPVAAIPTPTGSTPGTPAPALGLFTPAVPTTPTVPRDGAAPRPAAQEPSRPPRTVRVRIAQLALPIAVRSLVGSRRKPQRRIVVLLLVAVLGVVATVAGSNKTAPPAGTTPAISSSPGAKVHSAPRPRRAGGASGSPRPLSSSRRPHVRVGTRARPRVRIRTVVRTRTRVVVRPASPPTAATAPPVRPYGAPTSASVRSGPSEFRP